MKNLDNWTFAKRKRGKKVLIFPDKVCKSCGKTFNRRFNNRGVLKSATEFSNQVYCSGECYTAKQRLLTTDIVLASLNKLSEIQIAYLAGIFDGEGSVSLNKKDNGRGYSLNITVVCGCAKEAIETISKLVGDRKLEEINVNKYNTRLGWRLRLYGIGAERFLRLVQPYSLMRKEQIKLALEFQEGRIKRGDSLDKVDERMVYEKQCKNKLTLLNKRGLT